MAKVRRPKPRQPKTSIAERERRAARSRLLRAHKQERQIQTLARRLSGAINTSDRMLAALAAELSERADLHADFPSARGPAPEPARRPEPELELEEHEALHEYTAREASNG